MTQARVDLIERALTDALSPQQLEIRDDSAKHHGHAGATDGRGHFHVVIASALLKGKPLLAQHRAIYQALGTLMQSDIHALSIQVLPLLDHP